MTKDEALSLALDWFICYQDKSMSRNNAEALTDEAITAIKEALEQSEQEPVATLDDLEQEIYENTRQFVSSDVMEWMLKRYYTTPPQRTWVELTEQEQGAMMEDLNAYGTNLYQFARAIEAKLKEKNT